ncbi:MAG: hypothetical protein IKU17_03910 [Clostridia bacterium]|nr:hypothetical protein [Clostridia bacterium]
MIQEKINALHLPDLLTFNDGTPVESVADWQRRREELIEFVLEEEYGKIPNIPLQITCEEITDDITDTTVGKLAFAGKAVSRKFMITVKSEKDEASFPFNLVYPNTGKPAPVIVHIAFNPLPHNYLPLEEVIDNGFAVVNVYYNDITLDKNEYESGIAKLFGEHAGNKPGKIAMWAWAASRILDQLEKLGCVDTENAAVLGHSRLGKTALLCGALDTRFKYVFPNDSGCCGTSISRQKVGETVHIIYSVFPFWFCENFEKYIDGYCADFSAQRAAHENDPAWLENEINSHREEAAMPFDQHFLAALVAPRYLAVGGAVEDTWADPNSEYLTMCEIDRVYDLLGMKGFVHPDRLPVPGDTFHEGTVGLHLRAYGHYLSRYDWQRYMEFLRSHP